MLRVGYVGLLYDYGKPPNYSYEYYNLESGLKDCQAQGMFDVQYWHPDVDPQQTLFDLVLKNQIDCLFHVEFNETFDLPEQIARLAKLKDIPVICWSSDSSWRFHNWILPRKARYSHWVTTHTSTLRWYKENHMPVTKSQWGCSPLYLKHPFKKEYAASFIGQKHGIRPQIVEAFIRANLGIDIWGQYWEGYSGWHGYASFEEMIQIFNKSKVCLNFSNPWHVGTLEQIKGRHFEIPAVGGFQLSTPADNLCEYFMPDREIVIANNIRDLVDKTQYYLIHEKEREEIAQAGYERAKRDHQWSNRFKQIFGEIELL